MMKEKNARITIGYSTHRVESLAFADEFMASHEVIVLEDPPTPGFENMLKSEMDIEEYLQQTDTEYPEFAYRQCLLMHDQYERGKQILQIEPFMEILLNIHEFFADGGSPDQIAPGTLMFHVYQAEKYATSNLLDFYRASMNSGFEQIVTAVKNFARADAARFRLRDQLRARAIEKLLSSFSSVFVEAGEIHISLFKELRKGLPSKVSIKPRFLMEKVYHQLSGKRHIFGPGDILTLYYVFHPQTKSRLLDILALRSLIYSKLLEKEEIADSTEPFPHTRNELETIKKVNALSWDDCKNLFPKIRLASSLKARQIVDHHIS